MEPSTGAPTPSDQRALALALGLTFVGGIVVAVDTLMTIPFVAGIVGAALLLTGTAVAGVLAFRASRRTGTGILKAIGRGLRMLWRWFWHFAP